MKPKDSFGLADKAFLSMFYTYKNNIFDLYYYKNIILYS